ncbi:MAG TPA: RES family NAD+ phosphorylase [Longimicrobiaceae bacterium]|nr:RES family NAD+ phosphorylase [Longimicrobiaceae bacterium]
MSAPASPLWRVFPWDPAAAPGEPFSAAFIPRAQGSGRFDLPSTPVLYLAESPGHAVAEKIQRFRGQELEPWDLAEFGRTLALVAVDLAPDLAARVADLCDPAVLLEHGIRPDQVAARSRETTRGVADALHARGRAGIRWWSSMGGEWHAVTLFPDRVAEGALRWGEPEPLSLVHPAVRDAADALMIRRRG